MGYFQQRRLFPLVLGLLPLIGFLLSSCQNIIQVQPTQIPNATSMTGSETPQNALHLGTSTPFPTGNRNLREINQSVVVHNILLTLRSFQEEEENVRAAFCFLLPTDADWQIRDATLDAGNIHLTAWQTKFSFEEQPGNTTGSKRCIDLLFAKPDKKPLVDDATIKVERLITSMPELPDCNKAQEKLDSAKTGIRIGNCRIVNQTFKYDIFEKPKQMEEKEMYQTILNAFSNIIEGPWIFRVDLP